MTVSYSLPLPELPPRDCVIRCIVLVWSGDYPAQCEIAKTINGGKMACRGDKLVGKFVSKLC